MYKTAIEGESREHETVDDVIDHVTDKVHFEVDREALRYDLEHMDEEETMMLRDDCAIFKYEII